MDHPDDLLWQSLVDFVERHPGGWNHEAWEGLKSDLATQGLFDGENEPSVGMWLERARLLAILEGLPVKGLGPKRREAVADAYGRVWDLRQSSAEELASAVAIPNELAEQILTELA